MPERYAVRFFVLPSASSNTEPILADTRFTDSLAAWRYAENAMTRSNYGGAPIWAGYEIEIVYVND